MIILALLRKFILQLQIVIYINLDIFEKDLEGIYPIHYAVIFGNIKIIDFFISKEVPLDVKLEGNPLLHLSLSFAGIFLLLSI